MNDLLSRANDIVLKNEANKMAELRDMRAVVAAARAWQLCDRYGGHSPENPCELLDKLSDALDAYRAKHGWP
jgi:hypothetical protein